jgi:tyrosinase
MLVGTSPNDPIFWLNHANVDRLWWTWQTATTPRRGYQPVAPAGPVGQRSTDVMKFLDSPTWTPDQVLDIGSSLRLGYQYV